MILYLFLPILLLYFSFPNFINHFGFWPFAWVFAVPLFRVLEGQSLLRRLLFGVTFGLLFHALVIKWLIPYSLIGYILLVIALMIQPALFCALYRPMDNRTLDILFVPSLWVATEHVRTMLLNGFSWNLAHTQVFNIYALQTANLVGSWGISFSLILVNYCIYRAIKDPAYRMIYGAVGLSVVIFMSSYGFFSIHFDRSPSRPATFDVCAVQGNIDSVEKKDPDQVPHHIAQQAALSQHCLAKKKPDLIVWPETSISTDFRQYPQMQQQVTKFVKEIGVPVLMGAALWKSEDNQNSAVLWDSKGNIRNIYYKQYLVPFSEYAPAGKKFFSGQTFNFIPGHKTPLLSIAKNKFGVAICSEDAISSLFRKISKKGAGFVIVLLNDGWFKEEAALVMHGQNAIMRAAENRIPIVRVANTGWTSLIDRYGQVKSMHEPWFNTRAVVSYQVNAHSERTLYNRIGDVFAVICCLFVIIKQITYFTQRKKP